MHTSDSCCCCCSQPEDMSILVWNWRARAFLKLTDQTGSSLKILGVLISPLVMVKTMGFSRIDLKSSLT